MHHFCSQSHLLRFTHMDQSNCKKSIKYRGTHEQFINTNSIWDTQCAPSLKYFSISSLPSKYFQSFQILIRCLLPGLFRQLLPPPLCSHKLPCKSVSGSFTLQLLICTSSPESEDKKLPFSSANPHFREPGQVSVNHTMHICYMNQRARQDAL